MSGRGTAKESSGPSDSDSYWDSSRGSDPSSSSSADGFGGLVITYYSPVNALFNTATRFTGSHNLGSETDFPGWPDPPEFPYVGRYDHPQTAYQLWTEFHDNNERVDIALDEAENSGIISEYAYVECYACWAAWGDNDPDTPPNPNPGASVPIEFTVHYKGETYPFSLWLAIGPDPAPRILKALVIIDERGFDLIPRITVNIQ